MDNLYKQVARTIAANRPCVVLSGAGISAESGIPTFRSKGGLWDKYDPAVYASIEVFNRDPSRYWSIRGEFIRNYHELKPNPAHTAIADLEKSGFISQVITQNIDGLHKKAGSLNVIEMHGSLREIFCLVCRREYLAPEVPEGMPPLCQCGGVLKPNTVLFGEPLPPVALESAYQAAMTCGSMLVIGTSAVVYPAAALPGLAKQHGAFIVEINIEKAFADADAIIQEKAGIALPLLAAEIKALADMRIEEGELS